MFCPRCGAESDEGSRYCAACGADLPQQAEAAEAKQGEATGLRERLERMIGTGRSRMLSIGTALAVVVMVAAFIALPSDDDAADVPQDAYTQALDDLCMERKQEVAAAQEKAVAGGSLEAVSRYADSLVPIVGEWRRDLDATVPPADRAEQVEALQAALLEVEIEAGTLARVARESNRRGVAKSAAQVDAATVNVEATLDSLGLQRCGQL